MRDTEILHHEICQRLDRIIRILEKPSTENREMKEAIRHMVESAVYVPILRAVSQCGHYDVDTSEICKLADFLEGMPK